MEQTDNLLPNFINGQAENTIKAAYINTTTGIVENIIIVKSLEDVIHDGYVLVEVPKIELEYSKDELDLYNFLESIDPDFIFPEKIKIEDSIHIGITKWSEQEGFYE